ncbi:S1 RNA-binding domain-containing protein [Nocardioides sp. NPDC006273]|uniref:S1 RNA-binding domain-containing protein n=1 Tax=Nocardioides sp. NPDC006273 TaxID=3155598 RepID=UPI0033A17977
MLTVGQRVRGRVVRHEAYGAFVDIGESELAALLLDALIDDDPRRARDSLPAVGDEIEAVFLGYGPPRGTQPRISIRPSDFARADPEA